MKIRTTAPFGPQQVLVLIPNGSLKCALRLAAATIDPQTVSTTTIIVTLIIGQPGAIKHAINVHQIKTAGTTVLTSLPH